MKMRTLDGRLLDVRITITYPAPPERLDVTLICLEDLTDQRSTEYQLRQLQAEFARAARILTLGQLATSIAHEVNQPLSAIATNAETSLRRSEEHTSELQSLMRISYAVFCLKKKTTIQQQTHLKRSRTKANICRHTQYNLDH